MKVRFMTLMVGSIAGFGALLFNLYQLQISSGGFYAAKAESQQQISGYLSPARGAIYFTDRNGNKIPGAINRDYPIVFASPRQLKDPKGAAVEVAKLLGLSATDLANRFSKPNDSYELLAERVSDETADAIREASIPGVYVESENFRFYPFKSLAAHVLGFVGPSSKDDGIRGRYGVEVAYEPLLAGTSGSAEGDRVTEPVDGEDLVLTLDRNIQAQAEETLASLIAERGATGGTVIVEEPATGKLLALANAPTFDPNNYKASPVGNFLNAAVQSVYEPGSVFKVFTMAAGIDTGAITPQTTYVDSGSLTLNNKTITNADNKVYGKLTMTEVIEHSVNTGAAFAARKTGRETFLNYVENFGFGEGAHVGLPGEVHAKLTNLGPKSREINLATASFGQGVSVTPMELIAAVSAIANGGVLMHPYLLNDESPREVRRVIKKDTATKVTEMMASALSKAKVASIPGYELAGKTGTAQIPDFVHGGYTNEFIHTYVGFGPVADPRFVILIKLDKPKVGALAGITVVPAFRELAQFMLNYYRIPPDQLPAVTENPGA